VKQISIELGNRELYEAITVNLSDESRVENVISRLRLEFDLGSDREREIAFCSSHFYEVEAEDLRSLPFELFSRIISDKSIRLKDEDSFYSIIHSRICDDSAFFSLLEYVRFEYLSSAAIQSFIELTNESLDRMTVGLWEAICRRFSFPISPEFSLHRFVDAQLDPFDSGVCPFSSSSPMDGIISRLTREHGGHILDSGLISITASGIGNAEDCPLRNLATVGNDRLFYTADAVNSWICYDFKEMRLTLTHYSIRTRCDCDGYHLRCWSLAGSMDGSSWTELDRREDDRTLNGKGTIGTFSIGASEGNGAEFRMIRLQQTGLNSTRHNHLALTAMEFFGVVTAPRH
jgi:hypothetical protein